MNEKIKRYIKDPEAFFLALASRNLFPMSDKKYLEKQFVRKLGYELNLKNPKTYNEKIQWLKLYDRKPEYITMVDKYKAKELVAGIIGERYIIPTLGVWKKFDDIDFGKLPHQFVIKCTHDSGGVVVVKDKEKFNMNEARKKLEKHLRKNYYYSGREWPYKNVKPQIIVEQYLVSKEENGLRDYKFMCFNGKHKCTFVCTDRYSTNGLKVTFFDGNWIKMPFERHYPASDYNIEKPEKYDIMVELAEKLSRNLIFSRIDFYEIDGKIYFGEITLYPGNGMEEFNPKEWDFILGSWIQLPM